MELVNKTTQTRNLACSRFCQIAFQLVFYKPGAVVTLAWPRESFLRRPFSSITIHKRPGGVATLPDHQYGIAEMNKVMDSHTPILANQSAGNLLADMEIPQRDIVFKTLAICDSPHSFCEVLFTPTHFAWQPLTSDFVPFFAITRLFRSRIYKTTPWSAISRIELNYQNGEKNICVYWLQEKDADICGLKLTRIMIFTDWLRAFQRVGFVPDGNSHFRISSLHWLICDYGVYIWIAFLAVCSFFLAQVAHGTWIALWGLIPVIGLTALIWAIYKVRRWFPPGTSVLLHRYGKYE